MGTVRKIYWMNAKKTLPKFGGEYLVVYDLDDGCKPLPTLMDFDYHKQKFFDVIGANIEKDVLYWAHLPSPPKRIPK